MNNRFKNFYINKEWTRLYTVVSCGPYHYSDEVGLTRYGVNDWTLRPNKSFGSLIDTPHWTDKDFTNLIEMDKNTFRLLYRKWLCQHLEIRQFIRTTS